MTRNLAHAHQRSGRRSPVAQAVNDFFAFDGGLNLLDSPMSVRPGELTGALNYEIDIAGGYRRIGGYERFDGSTPPSEATYSLLGYGATARVELESGDTVTGDTSGANAPFLEATEEGGFGTNIAQHNTDFENASWDKSIGAETVTVVDDDETWAGGLHPTLTKVTESTGITLRGVGCGQTMNVAVGDMVYVSCFARFTSGQREGIRLDLSPNTAWDNTTFATFNVAAGSVYRIGTAVDDAGIELVGDDVYRCWMLMHEVSVADTITMQIRLVKNVSGTLTQNYTGNGASYIHITGAMFVKLPFDGPHNLFNGRDISANWSVSAGTMTVSDGAGGAINPFADSTRLTDAGGTSQHRMRATKSGNTSPIKVRTGDRLYVEWYGRYTAGQIPIQYCSASVFVGASDAFGGTPPFLYANLSNGSIYTGSWLSSVIDTYAIELIDTDRYKISFTTIAAVADADFGLHIGHALESGSAPDISYASTGLYSDFTGFRAVSLPTGGNPVKLGFVATGAASENVKSGELVLGSVTSGPYTDDEDLSHSSTVFAAARGADVLEGESDPALDASYTALAVAVASAAAAPPGSGPVRGVWVYNGRVYAFRDNAGATACIMYQSSASGWTAVTLNDVLAFDAGDNNTPAEGDTVTGATSSASAEIKRIVLTSGTWGVNAAGYFVLGTVTGGPFQNNEELQVSAARVADADGANAAPTLSPGGRYEFRNHNFYGASDKYRMYGVDGVNKGFEYDSVDDFFCQITTGMSTDAPDHLAVHNYHLIYSFPGGSVQISDDGDPVGWRVFLGATEIAVGDDVTGFIEEVGNSLFIYTRKRTYVLQGNSVANFDLDDFNVNMGAREWSLQRLAFGTYLDDPGFTTIQHQDEGGSTNFLQNTVSARIQPLVKDLVSNATVKCSHLVRSRNIYRCYFDDGRVVSMAIRGRRVAGFMALEYPFVAAVAVSGEIDGAESLFAGDTDGNVYRLEENDSFDGADIPYYLRTVPYHSGSPGRVKKYAYARVDAQLNGSLTLFGELEYDFDNPEFNLADPLDFCTDEAGGYWDEFYWDNFTWDKPTSGIPQVKLEGEGVNVATYLYGSAKEPPHTLRGMSLQWRPRRIDRRV